MSDERPGDDAIRAASDMIDAWCAANPAPAWPVLPEGIRAQDYTEVWRGALGHGPVGGETTAWFGAVPERVEVTYTRSVSPEQALLESLTEEEKLVIYGAASEAARLSDASAAEVFSALISAMANCWAAP